MVFYPKPISKIALLVVLAGSAFAIRMSPASFTARNIPVGERFNLSVPLVIHVDKNAEGSVVFLANPLLPSEVRENWLEGYEEIPDPAYLIVGGERPIVAKPDSAATRRLLVDFPGDSSLMNRRFLVQLRIMPEDAGGMFQTVLVGSYLLETVSTENRFTRPGGLPIAFAPSVLKLDEDGNGIIRVYNNDSKAHDVSAYISVPVEENKLSVELTRGNIPGDPKHFELDRNSASVGPGEFIDISISMPNIEYRESLKRNTEVLLWVKDPAVEKSARFVRVNYLP